MDVISWQLLIEGAWTTLWISAIAIAFGVVIGLLIALVRMLRLPIIDQLLVVYISLARATPLVTLVLFLFLSLPTVGINLDKNVAAIVALTLNTSAFNAEIWRNAFRTFPREQREAAESVGDAPLDLFSLHHAAANVDRKPAGAGERNVFPD